MSAWSVPGSAGAPEDSLRIGRYGSLRPDGRGSLIYFLHPGIPYRNYSRLHPFVPDQGLVRHDRVSQSSSLQGRP